MKKIEIKNITRFLYIPVIIFFVALFFNVNNILSQKAFILTDNKIIPIKYEKNKLLSEILKENNIRLNPDDLISADLSQPVKADSKIKITRVKITKGKEKTETAFRPIWRKTYATNLRKVELQKGVVKTTKRESVNTYHDNVLKSVVYNKENTVSKTFYRLLLLDKRGNIEKTFDLSKAKRMKMIATAYYPGDPLAWRDGTITFLGQKMQRGIVAVDPKVIPLRTRLYISGYGYGYAGDTGSAIIGNRIDLGVNNAAEEKSWMHREVIVYILDKSKTY
ncbi:MAG: 3D domain-containing protein [Endomicrobiaceae bacterium]|jgi:3D (Asp-Asp-Asp) domain-containing protein|nr:3D domain-containing protein [Endomicrobiaceae bacterium]MDD3730141.1 3D domain-containing protein [Endomicrobiaceae bacterium]MDD4166781.1 3D domain-containing protein [Endomicrobiaceae bacterium]